MKLHIHLYSHVFPQFGLGDLQALLSAGIYFRASNIIL